MLRLPESNQTIVIAVLPPHSLYFSVSDTVGCFFFPHSPAALGARTPSRLYKSLCFPCPLIWDPVFAFGVDIHFLECLCDL